MSAEELMPVGSRVKLKPDCVEFYQIGTSKFDDEPVYVAAESEAHVLSHREDDGFDLVLIRWDREDWRYAGQPDGWAYPNHFEVVAKAEIEREPSPEKEETVLRQMVGKAMKESEDRCSKCGHRQSDDTDEERARKRYLEVLSKGSEAAAKGEGFLLLSIVEDEEDGRSLLVPHFYSASMTDEAAILLEAQTADVVSAYFRAYALERLKEIKK